MDEPSMGKIVQFQVVEFNGQQRLFALDEGGVVWYVDESALSGHATDWINVPLKTQ